MNQHIQVSSLKVAPAIFGLVNTKILPGTGISQATFWDSFAAIVEQFVPINRRLLEVRQDLQEQIDDWHKANRDANFASYKNFLTEIGYLVPVGDDFEITPVNVDSEITHQAGPQLVVPIMNARFALNAVNARWGSLYDALYGNDVISEDNGADKSGGYNPVRGQRVIDYGRDFLDMAVPLLGGSHHQTRAYRIIDGRLQIQSEDGSILSLE
ncbi:MAG TPA: malate synthase G, partial [Porticoccaceae bacterium]|nr:malate synthase G [Porticoccaceae bacterium]